MGIIVLAVAILPMLGIGGIQLFRAEVPGPVKDNNLTPRITETAKALWYIYAGLTAACATGYALGGMSVFDAICHSFSTVAIGGFSTPTRTSGTSTIPSSGPSQSCIRGEKDVFEDAIIGVTDDIQLATRVRVPTIVAGDLVIDVRRSVASFGGA